MNGAQDGALVHPALFESWPRHVMYATFILDHPSYLVGVPRSGPLWPPTGQSCPL